MSAHLQMKVTCFMTPADLRMIADKMDEVLKQPLCQLWGKSLTVYTWSGEDIEVDFAIDQERALFHDANKEVSGTPQSRGPNLRRTVEQPRNLG